MGGEGKGERKEEGKEGREERGGGRGKVDKNQNEKSVFLRISFFLEKKI